MKKILFILLTAFLIPLFSISQTTNKSILLVFYNVENLFDTINNPNTADDEFTPNSKKDWNTERYYKKQNDIAKVISSINKVELPAIIGLAEVENFTVLNDLIQTDELLIKPYAIIHEESPDMRGIDVALLYRKDQFKYLLHKKIPIKTEIKVRDILYVKGILNKTDTVHIFVNHWKSRYGGQEQTEPDRIVCAKTLRNEIDSILSLQPGSKIIVMGDLNDEPKNKSVYETLGAVNLDESGTLFNLMFPFLNKEIGTYNYRNNWNILDHIIVSKSLLQNDDGFTLSKGKGQIFSPEWIRYKNDKGIKIPNRTYGGNNYFGGYSDHFPVYVKLVK